MNIGNRGVSRRDFVASAVAMGGTSALSACLNREMDDGSGLEGGSFPAGPDDVTSLPKRQFAWNEFLVHDAHGNTVLPQHQVLLLLKYVGNVPPSENERNSVEAALRALERAFQRGTGGNTGAVTNEGLLFTIGYSPRYFDELPEPVDLPYPETVIEQLDEDATADEYDAAIVLNADYGSIVLAAENALFGNAEHVNGVTVEQTLEGVFELAERRTGVIGKGITHDETGEESIPEDAPMSMGFKSGFQDNQAKEDSVTIETGPFAGGTTQMVSRLRIDVDRWYDQSDDQRVQKMFSPDHTVDAVGSHADMLGNSSGIDEETVHDVKRDAVEHRCVGHTQKTARARDDDFNPLILRRSESIATDDKEEGVVGMNFSSVQHRIADFVETRKAMNSDDLDGHVSAEDHGILDFIEIARRATYLIPPRELRALPDPTR
jgi:hypothetical protein